MTLRKSFNAMRRCALQGAVSRSPTITASVNAQGAQFAHAIGTTWVEAAAKQVEAKTGGRVATGAAEARIKEQTHSTPKRCAAEK